MTDPRFDVFLSYKSEDATAVELLARILDDRAGLRPWFDRWQLIPGQPWQRELERGLLASNCCAAFVGPAGRGPWQAVEVEAALRKQVEDRTFRVIPVLLPGAPAETPDLPLFLQGNAWVRFESLDNADAMWRLECGITGNPPGRGRPVATPSGPVRSPVPVPFVDPRELALPGGAIDTQSRYYVLRQADEEVLSTVRRPRGLVTVQGPRQSGKTSLILRALESVRQTQGDLRAAFVDFQALSSDDLESLESVWRAIADRVADQLRLDEVSWQEGRRYDRNFDRFLDRRPGVSLSDPVGFLCLAPGFLQSRSPRPNLEARELAPRHLLGTQLLH